MKLKLVALLCGVSYSCAVSAQNKDALYEIEVVQDSDTFRVQSISTEIQLKRKPFRFRFLLDSNRYVFFIASESDKYFITKPNQPFPVCLMFCGGAVGADNMFNPDKDICIYNFAQGISCWYYDSAQEHRFDGPAAQSDAGIFVERTIENLYDYPTKKTTGLKFLKKGMTLYIVFSDIDNEPCDDCETHAEVIPWRRYLKITFI